MSSLYWIAIGLVVAYALIIALLVVVKPAGLNLREAVAFVPNCLLLLKRLVTKSLHGHQRIVIALAVLYLVSPIDVIPDFIPVVGALDDVIVAIAALRYAASSVDRSEITSNWTGSAAGLALVLRAGNQTS